MDSITQQNKDVGDTIEKGSSIKIEEIKMAEEKEDEKDGEVGEKEEDVDEEGEVDKEEEDGNPFDMENNDDDDENQNEKPEMYEEDEEIDEDMTVKDGEINVDTNKKISNETLTLDDIDIKGGEEEDADEEEEAADEDEDNDDESEYSSDEEDNKMTEDINEKKLTLLDYHHECEQINYKELLALSKVIKKRGRIIDSMHKTIPILTRFERSKILGLRTKQLNDGAEPFYEVPSNIIDSYYIAEQELEKKLLPFIIKRPVNIKCEYWKLADLKIL